MVTMRRQDSIHASGGGLSGSAGATDPGAENGRGAWFATAMAAAVRRLPFGLDRVVAPSLLGFLILNGFTFSVDLACLTAFHGGLHWPVPVSITASYLIAFGLNYALNRVLNFRSHGPVGSQLAVYAAVVTVNYLAWILGVGTGLTRLGVDYRAARVAAGGCEAVYMYLAMRWLVFRDTSGRATTPVPALIPVPVPNPGHAQDLAETQAQVQAKDREPDGSG